MTSNTLSLAKRIILFFLLVVTNSLHAQYLNTYRLKVNETLATKETFAFLTDDEQVINRSIQNGNFVFQSPMNWTQEYFKNKLEHLGGTLLSFEKVLTKETLPALEKAGGVDCETAQLLCSNTSQTANSSGAGVAELTGTNQGCLGIEHQASWYYLNVQTGGTLTMTINPTTGSDDYDFAIWGPFTSATAAANCPPVSAPIRCSFSALSGNTGLMIPFTGQTSSFGCGFLGLFACTGLITTTNNPVDISEGAGGDAWVQNLNVTAGQVYVMLVDNFSNSGNPYNMSFGGTGVLGCTPIVLPAEISSFSAVANHYQTELKFVTESEANNDLFRIEWSTDPESNKWVEVGDVKTMNGNATYKQVYTFKHTTPDLQQTNYYRLVQVDLDGGERLYPQMKVVNFGSPTKPPKRTLNLMGQEVDASYHGVVILEFEDGTIVKTVQ